MMRAYLVHALGSTQIEQKINSSASLLLCFPIFPTSLLLCFSASQPRKSKKKKNMPISPASTVISESVRLGAREPIHDLDTKDLKNLTENYAYSSRSTAVLLYR